MWTTELFLSIWSPTENPKSTIDIQSLFSSGNSTGAQKARNCSFFTQSQKWGRNNGRNRKRRKSGTRKSKVRKHRRTKGRSFEEADLSSARKAPSLYRGWLYSLMSITEKIDERRSRLGQIVQVLLLHGIGKMKTKGSKLLDHWKGKEWRALEQRYHRWDNRV